MEALRIAGGIVIATSGFSLLSGEFSKNRGVSKSSDAQTRNDIALTPLAIPMLAGPGSISLLIAFYSEHQETSEIIISVVAMVAVAIAILTKHHLAKLLGASEL
jgi:multiple antibiotic resistance protein